jgi:hypothetical protein
MLPEADKLYQGARRVNRTFALQIPFSLLYFQLVKLTFLARGRHLLEKNRTLSLIPREQVSEGLFLPSTKGRGEPMTLTAIGG